MTSDRSIRLPVELGYLALLALLWGSSYLFIKIAVATIPPITLIAARVTIAALVLVAVVAWRGDRLPRDGRSWRRLLVQAFLNSIGAWTVLAWGQQYVDSGLASVLNSTSPIFVFAFTVASGGVAGVGAGRMAGALIGFLGVILIVGTDVLAGLGEQVGAQLAILLGAVFYAGAAIYGRCLSHLSAPVSSLGTMLWACTCLIPLAVLVDRPWTLAPSTASILATLVLGTACTGGALLIYFRLVRTLGSMGVASQAYLRSGVGVILGVAFLGETVSLVVGIGLAAAIAGVAIINLAGRARVVGAR